MSRVEINAGGRHNIVDHDGTDLSYIVEKAESLWKASDPRTGALAVGFHPGRNGSTPAISVSAPPADH